ncbi:MAG: response regulator transcription factor [Armatimonadetes bacterium]|nr:response regulator transcription factor [Armatimonadota bacterium]
MNVLVAEDDESVARFLRQALREAGYVTQCASNGVEALELALAFQFDLILLDVMMPGRSGLEVCADLRARGVPTPILILTARDTLEDKIEGLDRGADDYLVKPFQVGELLARTRALLRRRSNPPAELKVGDLCLDVTSHTATRAGRRIRLSATEFSLLEYLIRNRGRVLTRSMILEHVWQYDFEGNDNILDVYVSYLRSKIDRGHPRKLIHTVRGMGYRIADDDAG